MPVLRAPPLAHTDEDEAASSRTAGELARQRQVDVMRKMGGDPDGRFFLLLLTDWANPLGLSDTPQREGVRRYFLQLKELMDEADPMLFPGLLAENAAEEVRRRAASPDA